MPADHLAKSPSGKRNSKSQKETSRVYYGPGSTSQATDPEYVRWKLLEAIVLDLVRIRNTGLVQGNGVVLLVRGYCSGLLFGEETKEIPLAMKMSEMPILFTLFCIIVG